MQSASSVRYNSDEANLSNSDDMVTQRILSDITVFNKYAKYRPELGRRETWREICDRNRDMHINKYPHLEAEIRDVYTNFVYDKRVLPSMRSMQFGGQPIELANNRIFNCAYAAANAVPVFSEAMFLLLGGTGLGYSVQKHHVAQLPVVVGPKQKRRRFLVGDSIEGWADAIKVLVESFFYNKADIDFDYRDVRPKGAKLITSGGKAPGPEPLRLCVEHLRSILTNAIGRKLTPLEVHDMLCRIADAVLAGGIRRAALISLFSHDDMDMMTCKSGEWYVMNPQRGRANNSVVLLRNSTSYDQFIAVWNRVEASKAGEPGIFWTNDLELGTNPCAEISLNDMQFCNLTELNVSNVSSQEELNALARAGAFLGTLQAGYTDFHYLRPEWEANTTREALIGVGQTGIASGRVLGLDLQMAAQAVVEENRRVAELIGINPSARTTTVKPSGTSSLTVGSSSGVHAWHAPYYIRRMRVGKNEALYNYMVSEFPEFIEDCVYKPHLEAVMSFPQKAPEGAILRSESPLDILERVKRFNIDWVQAGHQYGANYHNVSCTISLKDDEWYSVGQWMWNNRDFYTGIAILPYDGGTYVQAPFEDITESEYDMLVKSFHNIDLTKVVEEEDNTNLNDQVACAGGACEVDFTNL
jgi:ribonucleoside-triphosphate reductase